MSAASSSSAAAPAPAPAPPPAHGQQHEAHPYHYDPHHAPAPPPIAPDNAGYHLLEKMGWHPGHGLGKQEQGVLEPPEPCEPDKARADFEEGHFVEKEDEELAEEEQQHHF